LLEGLRRATRAAHDRLEARLPFAPPGPSRSAYRRVLEVFLGFYEPLETRLGELASTFAPLAWTPRRKTHLLRSDLLDLGATSEALARLPRCRRLPSMPGGPEALGCLYVVEGATLGGRVIARRLRVAGITPELGGRFFHGYGGQTGHRWTELVERLRMAEESADEPARTVEAAVATFEAFEAWLEQRGVSR
jgi:heme oxygenase (biliverdin-IX-beta and delta-forming)